MFSWQFWSGLGVLSVQHMLYNVFFVEFLLLLCVCVFCSWFLNLECYLCCAFVKGTLCLFCVLLSFSFFVWVSVLLVVFPCKKQSPHLWNSQRQMPYELPKKALILQMSAYSGPKKHWSEGHPKKPLFQKSAETKVRVSKPEVTKPETIGVDADEPSATPWSVSLITLLADSSIKGNALLTSLLRFLFNLAFLSFSASFTSLLWFRCLQIIGEVRCGWVPYSSLEV